MKTTLFLGAASSFSAAYPEVKSLKLSGTQNGEVGNENQRHIYYSESNLPKIIPCSNPHCRQGGFDLLATLITLNHSKESSYEGKVYCNGHEGTAKGRVKGDSCFNTLSFKIEATFQGS